jgi:hypothetical protein
MWKKEQKHISKKAKGSLHKRVRTITTVGRFKHIQINHKLLYLLPGLSLYTFCSNAHIKTDKLISGR